MALEDIRSVAESESKATQMRANAQSEAKRILAEAEKNGIAYAETSRAKAEQTVSRLMDNAKKAAQEQAAQSKATAQDQCAQLEEASSKRIELAARRIVERIVIA